MELDFSSLLPETRLHKLLTGPGSSLPGGLQDGPVGLGALSSAPAFLLVPLTPLAQRSIPGSKLQPHVYKANSTDPTTTTKGKTAQQG